MRTLTLFLAAFLTSVAASGQSVSITNGAAGATWSVASLTTKVTAAGKNYETFETSSASQTLLKVNALVGWTVSVQQSTSANWDANLKLSVRRTGDGTGGAIVSGGTTYIQLTSSNQSFFGGLLGLSFSRDNVPIQYKIDGLSVLLPVKTYTTTILYTVTGL